MVLLYFLRVKDKYKLQQTFTVDPVYLRHENSKAATDFMVGYSVFQQVKDPNVTVIFMYSNTPCICRSALADSPQQTFPFSQTLVCYALLWTEEPPGSYQTCKKPRHVNDLHLI